MAKKFTVGIIFLLAILIVRMLVQSWTLVTRSSINGLYITVSLIFVLLYLASSIGVTLRKQWGAVIAMIIGLIDLLFALWLGGPAAVGAGAIDVLILLLAYRQYKMTRAPLTTI